VFAGTLTVGIAATALAERRPGGPAGAVRGGTRQTQLLAAIQGTVAQLEQLAASDRRPAVRSQAEEAVTLAHSALGTARTVARAADQIDTAMRQLQDAGRPASGEGAVGRLRRRQGALIQRLSSTADQLLDVYGNLVETNATLATSTFTTGTVVGGWRRRGVGGGVDQPRRPAGDRGPSSRPPAGRSSPGRPGRRTGLRRPSVAPRFPG
jgi:hypothetical protein